MSPTASRTRVTGLLPPIATPLRDGRLDRASLYAMLDDLSGHVSGVLVGGSVGEVVSLTVEERIELMREVAAHVGDSMQLAVSVGDNSIENTRRLAAEAAEVGAALLVVAVPNYFANGVGMLQEYLGRVGEDVTVDLCLYDNPVANHTPLSVADIVALAEATPRLTHVKVTDTAVEKVAALRAAGTLVIHAGDDAVLWHQLSRGADGGMVALPMIYPERAAALWRAFQDGDEARALEIYREVTTFLHIALGAPDYVAVIKEVLHHRGVIASPELRLPLVRLGDRRRREVLAAFGG